MVQEQMRKPDNKLSISPVLLRWYEKNKRELPWRETSDPYIIWISEVILQQTRVDQGWDYFLRFIQRFPDAETLAEAQEDEVLKLWQGLGYYSRARNLHAAAKQVVTDFNGKFPATYSDVLSLKGVGGYTAAAIMSIAYNQPYAVVDGNVFRVISRLFAVETPVNTSEGKRIITDIAQSVLHPELPGTHNQAMMDFGATICTPARPQCDECPLKPACLAYIQNKVSAYPVKNRKKSVRNRYFHYFHIEHNGNTYIRRRGESDIWKNLYEFPLIETGEPADFVQLERSEAFKHLFTSETSMSVNSPVRFKHVLSHQVIYADFYHIILTGKEIFYPPENTIKIPDNQLSEYPVSRLIHKYLEII